jgi:hypothetical protein
VGEAYGPLRLVYNIRSTGGTNPGDEKYGSRNYRVDLDKVECTCNIPQLFHMPCSHVITSCKCTGLDHESEKFMSPFYLMSNTLKVWEPSFEPDLDLLKTNKGRRKEKCLRGVMDASNGYGKGMYGFGDFDEAPGQIRCFKCHKTGHTTATHNKYKKAKKLETRNGTRTASKPIKVHSA